MLASQFAMQRIAEPVEISGMIAFLSDNERASYITGEAYTVCGGGNFRLWENKRSDPLFGCLFGVFQLGGRDGTINKWVNKTSFEKCPKHNFVLLLLVDLGKEFLELVLPCALVVETVWMGSLVASFETKLALTLGSVHGAALVALVPVDAALKRIWKKKSTK